MSMIHGQVALLKSQSSLRNGPRPSQVFLWLDLVFSLLGVVMLSTIEVQARSRRGTKSGTAAV